MLQMEDLAQPESLPDSMKCAICFDLFKDPVFACGRPCQHAFCRSCITRALEVSPKCPTCRSKMWPKSLYPHLFSKSMLDDLLVVCPATCGWTGRQHARSLHVAECPIVVVVKEMEHAKKELQEIDKKHEMMQGRLHSLQIRMTQAEEEYRENEKRRNHWEKHHSMLQSRCEALQAQARTEASSPFRSQTSQKPLNVASWLAVPPSPLAMDHPRSHLELLQAVGDGNVKEVQNLVMGPTRVVNVNGTSPEGNTSLHLAACHGHKVIVKTLVALADAAVNFTNRDGDTPLHLAAQRGKADVVEYLVSQGGANVNVLNNRGESPLKLAIMFKHSDVRDFLLSS